MRHTLILALLLAVFWLLISGHYTLLMLSLGSASILLVICISNKMDSVDQAHQPVYLSLSLCRYHLWLAKKIIVANIMVVKHIWLGNQSITPSLAKLIMGPKTDLGKVICATSITLTPGTVVVDVTGNVFTVHALLRENIQDLQTGEMDSLVSRLEC